MEIILSFVPVLLVGGILFQWVAMLVHAVQNDIPNKPLWILVIVLAGVIIGPTIYYFAVYRTHNDKKQSKLTRKQFGFIALGICLVTGIVLSSTIPQPANLKEVALSSVIARANKGEIKRVEIKGQELKITKKGDRQPSEQSRKESGSSLYEQGLKPDAPVDIVIKK